MGSRMDKYKDNSEIPKRSELNQQLYKQIYNAYDEFENLIVPSNAKEIDLSDLKREVTNRDEYRKVKEYGNITNNKVSVENTAIWIGIDNPAIAQTIATAPEIANQIETSSDVWASTIIPIAITATHTTIITTFHGIFILKLSIFVPSRLNN